MQLIFKLCFCLCITVAHIIKCLRTKYKVFFNMRITTKTEIE